MYKIIKKEKIALNITKMAIEAPAIAEKARAGQFVIVVLDEKSERIPLTLSDWDKETASITLIFQEIGFTTTQLGKLEAGDYISHIVGPLGNATHIEKFGTVVCIGGGVGIAEVFPVSRALKEAGNKVIGIIGARSKDLIILEDEMRKTCDELFITTDDGSYGQKGFVSNILEKLIKDKSSIIQLVYAIGPVAMMQVVSKMTHSYGIKAVVNLNPIMVDGTGMCGACRVVVAGEIKFACVDGPEFDGHLVDFQSLSRRLNFFKKEEHKIMELGCKLHGRQDV